MNSDNHTPLSPRKSHRVAVWLFDHTADRQKIEGIHKFIVQGARWSTQLLHASNKLPEWLRLWKPDGIIANIYEPAVLRQAAALNIPMVSTYCWSAGKVPSVSVDQEGIGRVAAEHLVKQGLRNFAYFNMNEPADTLREKGFTQALAQKSFTCRRFRDDHHALHWQGVTDILLEEAVTGKSDMISRWIGSLPKPVGLMVFNDLVCSPLAQICLSMGLEVPRQVAIIGAENDPMICELGALTLSSVAVSHKQVGYRAAALLEQAMEGKRLPVAPELVPVVGVIQRQSSSAMDAADDLLAPAMQFIRNNAHRAFGVKEVCDAVAVSDKTLQRRFRKVLGRRMLTEIYRVHLERAEQLMISTQLPLSQVWQQSGFRSTQQFYAMFRKEMGLSPRQYCRLKSRELGLG